MLIGEDAGGGFVLLVCGGENEGVYYYDHAYSFELSNDKKNTYLIAKTFDDFMEVLRTTLPEPI